MPYTVRRLPSEATGDASRQRAGKPERSLPLYLTLFGVFSLSGIFWFVSAEGFSVAAGVTGDPRFDGCPATDGPCNLDGELHFCFAACAPPGIRATT